MAYDRSDWSTHYEEGRGFRPLRDVERDLIARYTPTPDGGRALDVGCGTGELAAHLAGLGYTVDAVDFAEGALARARKEHEGATEVRWLGLDIEHDDPADLRADGYDLITMRLMLAFVSDRTRVVRSLAARLRPGGAMVVITPVAASTPAERRRIALDEDEIGLLTDGWERVERRDAEGLAFLVLRGPGGSYQSVEKGRPEPQAVLGACVVVTDDCGRVLLGRSTRGMWELPGGRVETGECVQAAAVRELAEETGLSARVDDAYLLTILHDDRADLRRVSAVVRVSAWTGTPQVSEPHRFTRWEWHDLHTLAGLGSVFTPSGPALAAVWPGVLPGLPPVHSYPHADVPPTVGGEPAEAVRLRRQMTDSVVAKGWAPSVRVQKALRTVPRHRFAPESPLSTAYDDDLAVITRRDESGAAVSSISASWLQADMIEKLRLEPGMTVFEAGSGGYNAELMAQVTAPTGRVITVDIDPYVIHRTRRLTAEAGSGRVTAVLGDGSLGAPGHVPADGFDGVIITHNVWDIAPAWRRQLAEGRYLVLPLEIHGHTRAIAFQRQGDVLHARDWTVCGFVRDQGAAAHTTRTATLANGRLQLHFHDGPALETTGLDEALRGERHEMPTGVLLPGAYPFDTLQVYAATTLPGHCRLTTDRSSKTPLVATGGEYLPALVADESLAYLTTVQLHHSETPAESRWEFHAHAYGPAASTLAERLADCAREWDRHVRHTGYPPMTVHPAGTPDHELPAGHVLDKTASRLVFQWPGSPADTRPEALTAAGARE
ncbi:methyltransferase, FxLD system [Streptomyces sp. NPDC093589]|uniref:methyltransferase, FxLD system n=1 Tax=Streptomyces sp. NPDC093589 TaxID=3366043 RepID=UPI0038161E39